MYGWQSKPQSSAVVLGEKKGIEANGLCCAVVNIVMPVDYESYVAADEQPANNLV